MNTDKKPSVSWEVKNNNGGCVALFVSLVFLLTALVAASGLIWALLQIWRSILY